MQKKSLIILIFICLVNTGCAVSHLKTNANGDKRLTGCFPLPNCVSSNSFMFYNKADTFQFEDAQKEGWIKIKEVIKELPRTEVVTENDFYIHVKCKSLVFRFVDNLELLLDREKNLISVRSASFIAIFDLGVNWFRVKKVKGLLADKGLIKP